MNECHKVLDRQWSPRRVYGEAGWESMGRPGLQHAIYICELKAGHPGMCRAECPEGDWRVEWEAAGRLTVEEEQS